jgi:hypothetical protein
MGNKKRSLKLIESTRKQKTAQCPICKTVYDISDGDDLYYAQKCLAVCSSLKFDSLPKFARFKHDKKAVTVFRLEKIDPNKGFSDWAGYKGDPYLFYRVDNGCWGVEPYMKDGKIYSAHEKDWLDNKELVATTKKRYIAATGEYGCRSIVDPDYKEPEWLQDFLKDDIPF